MARRLPWLQPSKTDDHKRNKLERKPRSGISRIKDQHKQGGDDNDDAVQTTRDRRNASSLPSPAPPEETFMRPGPDADDAWRLVEDEFEMTARLFTRHLHQAEYLRQKNLAKARNQKSVDDIASAPGEAREPALGAPAQPSSIVAGATDQAADDAGGDPWLDDPRLANLMSRKNSKPAHKKISAFPSSSRAAYGFSKGQASPPKRRKHATVPPNEPHQGRHGTSRFVVSPDEHDSDDLDAPAYASNLYASRQTESTMAANEKAPLQPTPRPSTLRYKGWRDDDSSDDDDSESDDDILAGLATKKTKVNRAGGTDRYARKSTAQLQDAAKEDEIPTFLV